MNKKKVRKLLESLAKELGLSIVEGLTDEVIKVSWGGKKLDFVFGEGELMWISGESIGAKKVSLGRLYELYSIQYPESYDGEDYEVMHSVYLLLTKKGVYLLDVNRVIDVNGYYTDTFASDGKGYFMSFDAFKDFVIKNDVVKDFNKLVKLFARKARLKFKTDKVLKIIG